MSDKVEKDLKNEKIIQHKEEKAYFVQRLAAFIIDMFLVTFVVSLISSPFIDSKKIQKLENNMIKVTEKFQKNEISVNDYLSEYSSIYYKIQRNSGVVSFLSIIVYILYFVVYQIYAKGKTFGKKLMKIKIVSDDGDLSMNQMIFRSFISNFILLNIISFALMLFSSKSIYFYVVFVLELIQYIIVFISVIMILNSKNGLAIHDKIVHTRVLRENKE